MCRIVGFWDFHSASYDLEATGERMNNSLAHGGPDDAGVFVDRDFGVVLGSRRLAILDLSPLGHQPMIDEASGLTIAFNGEVYNFSDIKKELEVLGYVFKSHSDTEVILKAFKEWGSDCVQKFRGMFAFAIWDSRQATLTVIRDRVGVKPLYYYWHDGLFAFASETRAFFQHPRVKKQVDPAGVVAYFQHGYLPHPQSIWQNVQVLPPGTILTLVKNKEPIIKRYWKLEELYQPERLRTDLSEPKLLDELDSVLKDSFNLRMVSDVPVGVFLSGGIDSSIVTAVLQKGRTQPLKTFSVAFDDTAVNEAPYAKKIADYLHTDHTELKCRAGDGLSIIPQLAEIYDEPFGDPSAVPTHVVCREARKHVTVVLSGDGGDELFGGYDKYWRLAQRWFFSRYWSAPKGILKAVEHLFPPDRWYHYQKAISMLGSKNIYEKFALVGTGFLNSEMQALVLDSQPAFNGVNSLAKQFAGAPALDTVSAWMLYDGLRYLPDDILTKVDRASMHVALEAREPLLDHKIIEFITSLPVAYKTNIHEGKLLLKKLLARYVPSVYWDRPKQGFGIPLGQWLMNELKPLVYDSISESSLKRHGLLNVAYTLKFRDDFYSGRRHDYYKLWYLLVFQLWAERWL